MKINANSIRVGNVIEHNNRLWSVAKISHTQPGKGGAFVQVEMKDIKSGTKLNERFRSSENIEKAFLDEKQYQYLYAEGSDLILMDLDSYEQISVDGQIAESSVDFLQDEMNVTVTSYEGSPISLSLPEEVTLEVVEADAVVKGQTATSSYKPAKLSNGVKIMVPQFIGVSDMVVVKTFDGSYVERVKKNK